MAIIKEATPPLAFKSERWQASSSDFPLRSSSRQVSVKLCSGKTYRSESAVTDHPERYPPGNLASRELFNRLFAERPN
jgi:hypothetical protein